MTRLPTLFLSHGSPMHALDPGGAGEAWHAIAAALPRPRAVLVASAHWETSLPMLSGRDRHETIHDFSGFPAPLYQLRYDAPGDPSLAQQGRGVLSKVRGARRVVAQFVERSRKAAEVVDRVVPPASGEHRQRRLPVRRYHEHRPRPRQACSDGLPRAARAARVERVHGRAVRDEDGGQSVHDVLRRPRPACGRGRVGWMGRVLLYLARPSASSVPCARERDAKRAPAGRPERTRAYAPSPIRN